MLLLLFLQAAPAPGPPTANLWGQLAGHVFTATVLTAVFTFLIRRWRLRMEERGQAFDQYQIEVSRLRQESAEERKEFREEIKELRAALEEEGKARVREEERCREQIRSLQAENDKHRIEIEDGQLQVVRLRARLDNFGRMARVAVVTCDETQTILAWNTNAVTLFGYTTEEVIGKVKIEVLIATQLRDMHNEAFARAVQRETVRNFALREGLPAIRKDGSIIFVDVNLSGYVTEGKKIFQAEITQSGIGSDP